MYGIGYMMQNQVNKSIKTIAPAAATAFVAVMLAGAFSLPAAFAAVTFDPATGTGFVGKGDVQTALGYNNKQLQDNAGSLQFTFVSTTVSETSWECTNENNDKVQERERTTTTETTGVIDSIARERNQITGFNLMGFSGDPVTDSSTDGPKLNSCPANPSGWVLTTPAGDPEIISQESTLFVNGVELQQTAPVA